MIHLTKALSLHYLELQHVGGELAIFAIALLLTEIIYWLLNKIIKNNQIKNGLLIWYNVILSTLLFSSKYIFKYISDKFGIAPALNGAAYVILPIIGIYELVITLIIAIIVTIIGIKKPTIAQTKASDWAFGIIMIVFGILVGFTYSYEEIIIGILWILISLKWSNLKIWKLPSKTFFGVISLLLSIFFISLGDYYDRTTAHIYTIDNSVTLRKRSVLISGRATPKAKISIYLEGYKVVTSDPIGNDGYFNFKAYSPGKWTVKVTKNGETSSASTIVKKPIEKYLVNNK